MTQCISLYSIKTEISAEHEFISLTDLKSEIATEYYRTRFKDFKSDISVTVPFLDLKTAISAGFPPDLTGPYIIPETYPLDGEGGISIYGPIFIVVEDLISGIDLSSLELTVNSIVYTQDSSEITCLPITVPYRYAIKFVPSTAWDLDSEVTVSIFIKDRTGNPGMVDLTTGGS